jgi:chemotaxis signal transduction protein
MTTMVFFSTAQAAYCMPVDATRGVRRSTGMVTLPAPRVGIAGIIPGDPPMTVMSALGGGGNHILILESGTTTFGLLVDSVTGLRRIAAADIGPPPEGQDLPLVSGTIDTDGDLVLVADLDALAGRL